MLGARFNIGTIVLCMPFLMTLAMNMLRSSPAQTTAVIALRDGATFLLYVGQELICCPNGKL